LHNTEIAVFLVFHDCRHYYTCDCQKWNGRKMNPNNTQKTK
jgi:hypothetical protein